MCSITVMILCAFIAQATGKEQVSHRTGAAQEFKHRFADKLVNNILKKSLEASSLHNADLDSTMLGKPGHLAISSGLSLPVLPHTFPLRGRLQPAATYMQPATAQQSARTGQFTQATMVLRSMQPARAKQSMQTLRAEKAAAASEGLIRVWRTDRGFGYIVPSAGGDDIFCDKTSLIDEDRMQKGDRVTFKLERDEGKGKNIAVEVRLVPGGEAEEGSESGMIVSWNNAKGWGFIQPSDGADKIFCHYNDLRAKGSMEVGDKVTYNIKQDATGRYQAAEVGVARGARSS
eukprot:gnl/TRDRNA2_/TRDRNA2_210163_c0_seq1.p1 gnl/TRDRNA2_/TRDRNA2_210163_c0~~gnl/TRDRNA2_/TRDRNA2_210163_c0_seq1.p1  ORF type:complete len:289 (+),score=51.39 gnl/TRDRNA2_/TRDRNA2_210163_c0_seq1:83-949(+)